MNIIETEKHVCELNEKLIKCQDGLDTYCCEICGKIWTEPCVFEEYKFVG